MTALPTVDARVTFRAFGAPDVLEVEVGGALPEPGPGEARIRIEASSVQYTDTLIRGGSYPGLKQAPPLTPGYDLVGVVDAVGDGVSAVAVGDRVADLCTTGGNARYAVRPAAGLVPVPVDLDAAAAATLVLSWVTAWQCLHRVGSVQPGQKVLVLGGNGAVGQALIALTLLAGATPYATASERHHASLRALGAAPLPREGWLSEVEGQMDIVVDGVCVDAYRSSYAAVKTGGALVPIGFSAAVQRGDGSLSVGWAFLRAMVLLNLWPDGKRSHFYSITGLRVKQPGWFRADLTALFELLQRGAIQPTIAERLPLEQVREAHIRLERGGLSGKLVLEPWSA